MDFSKEISEFMCNKVHVVTIIEADSSKAVYGNSDTAELLTEECPALTPGEPPVEWELLDISSRKYYKCYSSVFEKNNKKYNIHLQTDITEYMSLNRDVTKYMSFFKRLSAFQTVVLEHLSTTYYELLEMLSEYFKADKAYFVIQRNDKLDVITYNCNDKIFDNDRVDYSERAAAFFDSRSGNETRGVNILCTGNALEQNYAIAFDASDRLDIEAMSEKSLVNVIRLFVENTMLREKLVYESEHDSLTGLYNKDKYLSMVENDFPNMNSIAVFNFDVNDLKLMNDNYGHEAGDKLLIKAADSIRKVVNSKTFGFRMGGDEFLMVAVNVTEAEIMLLRKRWEEELARLNEACDGIRCVMALGVAYGKAPYDFAQLSKQADGLMYEDKKVKKGGREIR